MPDAVPPYQTNAAASIGLEPRHITTGSPGAVGLPATSWVSGDQSGSVSSGAHVVGEMVTDYEFSGFG
jgi:hypothetical protein